MFERLIGISFISLAADLLISDSTFRKYIKAVIGMFFILTLLQGIIKLDIKKPDFSLLEEAERIAAENQEAFEEKLENEVVLTIEKNITACLSENGIEKESLTVDFENGYKIKKLRLKLKNYSKDGGKAIELLVNQFGIDKEVIEIC